jgi:hypothetical protein
MQKLMLSLANHHSHHCCILVYHHSYHQGLVYKSI